MHQITINLLRKYSKIMGLSYKTVKKAYKKMPLEEKRTALLFFKKVNQYSVVAKEKVAKATMVKSAKQQ